MSMNIPVRMFLLFILAGFFVGVMAGLPLEYTLDRMVAVIAINGVVQIIISCLWNS